MKLYEQRVEVKKDRDFSKDLPRNTIRFSIVEETEDAYICEIGLLEPELYRSIFDLRQRNFERTEKFTTVVIVPTGVDATIGGHAGDAGPVVKLFGSISDRVITHPNVVNASDINEMPENCLYVEGSVLDRLLMGTVWLEPVRNNRVLVVLDAHEDEDITNLYMNAVSAAQATYGLDSKTVVLPEPLKMKANYNESGRATGSIENFEIVSKLLESRNDYDAVAIASIVDVPNGTHENYFQDDDMINPWGGVEALLTHAISFTMDKPSAHSPMCYKEDIVLWPPLVDHRKAAEAISNSFLQCILKGLQRSPRIHKKYCPGLVAVEDVSCIVVPSGCYGIPIIAADFQHIPVIEVEENATMMNNELPNSIKVKNYWEAAGIVASIKAGIKPGSVRR